MVGVSIGVVPLMREFLEPWLLVSCTAQRSRLKVRRSELERQARAMRISLRSLLLEVTVVNRKIEAIGAG